MAKLSPEQLATLAQAVGFSSTRQHRGVREDAVAVAVALGESGGHTEAHNTKAPDNSYGLWQINMYGGLGPERRRQFGIGSNDELLNATTNGKAAFRVFTDAGNSFRPWSVYTSGSYVRHLGVALLAVKNPGDLDVDQLAPGEGSDSGLFASLGEFVSFITSAENWIRVAQFVGGGLLVLAALAMLAGKGVMDVLPVKKLAKAVRG